MKKAVSPALISLLVIGILIFPLKTAHSPQQEGQFAVDDYTLALWHLNEGEGQVLHDESPHHNDGTLGLTSNAEDTDPSWVSGCTGETGDYALSFDQYFDHAYIPDNPDGSLDLQLLPQFTIEFWTYSRQISRADRGEGDHWNHFFHKAPAPTYPEEIINGYGVSQSLRPQPTPLFFASMYSGSGPTVISSWGINVLPPLLNEWVLITIVYDGNHSRIYFNNIMQAVVDSWRVGDLNFSDNAAPFVMGDWPELDWPWADSVDGIIDEVRLSSIARDRVHNIDTGLNYGTIQEAIDAPETLNNHTIHVDAGTYYETIVVDKSVNLVGENRETTIIDGNESMTVVLAKADHVSIRSFTVQNSYRHIEVTGHISLGKPAGGIALEGCIGCTVTNNKIEQCGAGVAICIGSGDNIITGNIVHGLPPPGYFAYFGITDWAGPQTPVGGNTISFNYIEGFGTGILLDDATNDEIHENRILLSESWGIRLGGSNNKITQNVIKGSKEYGILLLSSGNIICHNDFIDNAVQVCIDTEASVNVWDDGYPLGGNYWSDYAGVDVCRGENQDRDDSGDTIGDTPYVIEVDNEDRYPLMERWSFQGDIDRNGKVNILDVSMAARSFGAQPGEIRWDHKADVTRDGVVNIVDLAKTATQFNKVRWQFE